MSVNECLGPETFEPRAGFTFARGTMAAYIRALCGEHNITYNVDIRRLQKDGVRSHNKFIHCSTLPYDWYIITLYVTLVIHTALPLPWLVEEVVIAESHIE